MIDGKEKQLGKECRRFESLAPRTNWSLISKQEEPEVRLGVESMLHSHLREKRMQVPYQMHIWEGAACLERPSPGQESERTHPKRVCVSEASGETAAESGTEQTTFQRFSLEKALGCYLLRSKVKRGNEHTTGSKPGNHIKSP